MLERGLAQWTLAPSAAAHRRHRQLSWRLHSVVGDPAPIATGPECERAPCQWSCSRTDFPAASSVWGSETVSVSFSGLTRSSSQSCRTTGETRGGNRGSDRIPSTENRLWWLPRQAASGSRRIRVARRQGLWRMGRRMPRWRHPREWAASVPLLSIYRCRRTDSRNGEANRPASPLSSESDLFADRSSDCRTAEVQSPARHVARQIRTPPADHRICFETHRAAYSRGARRTRRSESDTATTLPPGRSYR